MIVLRRALRSPVARSPPHRRVLDGLPLRYNVPVLGGLGVGAGLTASLSNGGGRSHADEAQEAQWVQAWLPSPASLVGEPTVACEAAATSSSAASTGKGWEDEFDSWERDLMKTCSDCGLTPRKSYSGPSASDGHWTAEWHLMRGRLWGEGALEKLRIWRPAGQMIDGDVLCLVRLGDQVCGHKIFIHGGFTAALFDELFGYQFGTLNREAKLGKINFTGNLVVDYRRPVPKNGTYLVRLWIEKIVDGRKGYLKGQLEDRDGKVYVESTSLYVVPRAQVTPDICDARVKNFKGPLRAKVRAV